MVLQEDEDESAIFQACHCSAALGLAAGVALCGTFGMLAQDAAQGNGQRTDGQIEMDVVHALDASQALKNDLITAATIQSAVTLAGTVSSDDSKKLAESIVKGVPGVTGVQEQFEGRQPCRRSECVSAPQDAQDDSPVADNQQQGNQQRITSNRAPAAGRPLAPRRDTQQQSTQLADGQYPTQLSAINLRNHGQTNGQGHGQYPPPGYGQQPPRPEYGQAPPPAYGQQPPVRAASAVRSAAAVSVSPRYGQSISLCACLRRHRVSLREWTGDGSAGNGDPVAHHGAGGQQARSGGETDAVHGDPGRDDLTACWRFRAAPRCMAWLPT